MATPTAIIPFVDNLSSGSIRTGALPASDFELRTSNFSRGFTLIEIMIVVGIMGIIMTMSVPIVWKVWHKAPMSKAIADVVEVCSNARARAILQGHEVDVIFYPRERRLGLGSGSTSPISAGPAPASPPAGVPQPLGGSGTSAQLPEQVVIEDLDINKIPGGFRDADQARVRFFPNGTSDELSLFLVSDGGQRCEILLEVTTGLASVEWDVRKFH